jgi:hypothetical protein
MKMNGRSSIITKIEKQPHKKRRDFSKDVTDVLKRDE